MQQTQQGRGPALEPESPLLAIIDEVDGQETVTYFTDERQLEEHVGHSSIQDALRLAGAWKGLADWEEVFDQLDRIRHESRPTPPFEL